MAEGNVPIENVAMHLTVSSTHVANPGAVYLTSEPMNPAQHERLPQLGTHVSGRAQLLGDFRARRQGRIEEAFA